MSITVTRTIRAPVVSPVGANTVYVYSSPDRFNGITADNKHVTAAVRTGSSPLKVYFTGGDHLGPDGYGSSYNQDTFSVDVASFRASGGGNAGWTVEYPYGGYGALSVQPKHPDKVGFNWDSSRQLFWMVPGLMVGVGGSQAPGETSSDTSDTNFIYREPMQFHPDAANSVKWTRTSAPFGPTGFAVSDDAWHTVYDPVNDVVFRGKRPSTYALDIFNCATQTWTARVTTSPIGLIDFANSQFAPDYRAGQRKFYFVDGAPNYGHLWSIAMDSPYTMTDLGKAPGAPGATSDAFCNTVWDSTNNVLIFHRECDYRTNNYLSDIDRMIYVYDPALALWEYVPIVTSPADSEADRWQSRGAVFLSDTAEVLYYGGSNG